MILGKFSTSSFFIHICMTVCLCTTYVLCPHRPEEGTGSPETSQPRECWGQNLGPLESQCSQLLYHLSSPSLPQEFSLKISFLLFTDSSRRNTNLYNHND